MESRIVHIAEEFLGVVRKQPLLAFVISTFIFSWVLWYFAGAYSEISTNNRPLGDRWLLAQIGVFAPAVCALVVGRLAQGGESISRMPAGLLYVLILGLGLVVSRSNYEEVLSGSLATIGLIPVAIVAVYVFSRAPFGFDWSLPSSAGSGLKWIALSTLLAPGLMIVSMLIANGQVTTASYLLGSRSVPRLLSVAIYVFSFNLLLGGSVGEEPGWRGFALPILLKSHTPFVASLILSFIWALWHAPLDVAHGFMLNGMGAVVARIIWTLPLTFLFTYFFLHTNGSVLIAVLLHTSINFSFEFFQPSNGAIGVFSLGLAMSTFLAFARGG